MTWLFWILLGLFGGFAFPTWDEPDVVEAQPSAVATAEPAMDPVQQQWFARDMFQVCGEVSAVQDPAWRDHPAWACARQVTEHGGGVEVMLVRETEVGFERSWLVVTEDQRLEVYTESGPEGTWSFEECAVPDPLWRGC